MDIAFYNFKLSIWTSRRHLRKAIIEWINCAVIALIIVAIFVAIFWAALTTPTEKDKFEATRWQKYQAEMQTK
jgi:hypothetical protein